MKREGIKAFLGHLGAQVVASSRESWVVSHCPLAPWRHKNGKDKNPSFGVRIEPGDSFTSCFSCQYHGRQSDLVLEMRYLEKTRPSCLDLRFGEAQQLILAAEENVEPDFDDSDMDTVYSSPKSDHHVFPEWWLDSFAPAEESKTALAYLAGREGGPVPLSVIRALDLRWDAVQRRVCFPMRDEEKRLRGLHGRAVDAKAQPKYRMYTYQSANNPLVWLGEDKIDLGRPILVAESVFDYARAFQCCRNVITPLSATMGRQKIRRLSGCIELVTLFDPDPAGDIARAKFRHAMDDAVVRDIILPDGQDAGATPVQDLAHILAEHVELDDILLD